ncbi:MAG: hypothetical protein OXI26_03135, partial [bacterium]|nr:hypothetical protein [bacterium]
MRKIGFLLFALALVAGACGGEDSSPAAPPAPAEPAPAASPSPDPAPAEPAAPPAPADTEALPELTLSVGHSGAPDGFADIASVKFKELVEERTDGRFTVEVFPSGQLGGERELV